jgi:hypothetical protein
MCIQPIVTLVSKHEEIAIQQLYVSTSTSTSSLSSDTRSRRNKRSSTPSKGERTVATRMVDANLPNR